MEKKETYNLLDMSVIEFDSEDVIVTSNDDLPPVDDNNGNN